MHVRLLFVILVLAGCTSSSNTQSVLVQLENESSAGRAFHVNLDDLGGERIGRFELAADAGEKTSRRTAVPDVETVLVSVEADGKTVGAKSISPKECPSSPFRIHVSASGAVSIPGKRC